MGRVCVRVRICVHTSDAPVHINPTNQAGDTLQAVDMLFHLALISEKNRSLSWCSGRKFQNRLPGEANERVILNLFSHFG